MSLPPPPSAPVSLTRRPVQSSQEALNQRLSILEETQAAEKVTITKRRAVERMKASSSIVPSKVDDAIDDMEEAQTAEEVLSTRLANVSDNLQLSLRVHSRQAHEDLAVALLENARLNIRYERAVLGELESLRGDIKNVNNLGPRRGPGAVDAPSVGGGGDRPGLLRGETEVRRQQAMPPTRTWVDQPRLQPPPQQHQPPPLIQRSQPSYKRGAGFQPRAELPSHQQQQEPFHSNPPSTPHDQQRFVPRQQYLQYPQQQQQPNGYRTSGEVGRPESPSQFGGPSQGGGRRDLSQSMYQPSSSSPYGVRSSSSASHQAGGPPPPTAHGGAFDPLGGLSSGPPHQQGEAFGRGPGGGPAAGMTQSFYQPPTQAFPQQPQRRRIDPREAASKLGKGF